jgi:hypothetical protein
MWWAGHARSGPRKRPRGWGHPPGASATWDALWSWSGHERTSPLDGNCKSTSFRITLPESASATTSLLCSARASSSPNPHSGGMQRSGQQGTHAPAGWYFKPRTSNSGAAAHTQRPTRPARRSPARDRRGLTPLTARAAVAGALRAARVLHSAMGSRPSVYVCGRAALLVRPACVWRPRAG